MTPHYADDTVTLHHGDCLDIMRQLPDSSVDAVVTDPPYGLEFMGKDWDGADGFRRSLNAADAGRDNAFGRTSRTSPEYRAGSLFQEWCQLWAVEALRVLKPGGHLLAFGGTRTWHRLAVAVEDAGFEMRDSIAWLYGSGFPKSHDVSKAIDKAGGASPVDQAAVLSAARTRAGLTREQVAEAVGCTASSVRDWEEGRARATGRAVEHVMPSAEYRAKLADLLGYTADERVVVGVAADRRGDGTVVGLGHSGVEYTDAPATDAARTWQGWGTALKPAFEPIVVGRKPLVGTVAANVLAHGTGALNVDGCRIEGAVPSVPQPRFSNGKDDLPGHSDGRIGVMSSAPGGRWPANVVLDEDAAVELDAQSGTTTSGVQTKPAGRGGIWSTTEGQAPAGPQYGDTGGASRFFYVAKAPTTERPRDGEVAHPTVKPLDLMRWLVRLVTPPGGVVLEPFAGSGTTAEACVVEGFRCIAIEREAAYLPLIVARLSKPIALDLFGGAA